jgi:lysozyme
MRHFSAGLALAALLLLSACGSSVPVVGDIPEGASSKAGAGNSHFTDVHPNDFSIHGIDVSKYQGDVDWEAVKRSGVKFAWIKATEGGNHVDEKFMQNWTAAADAGVPRGAYHFVWWCRPPHEEIGWFKRNVPVDPNALPPVLDVEATPGSKTCKRTLYRDEVLREMREMLADLERHYGKKPIIYVTVDFYESIMHPDEFADYPVWVRSTKYAPHVKYPGRRWMFWQYQSDGSVSGVNAKVDRNAFHGTYAQWKAFLEGKHVLR